MPSAPPPPLLLLLPITVFLLPCFLALAKAQQDEAITMGSVIIATRNGPGAAWTSPSRRFAFGFYAVENEFAIGIWFVTNNTVIWTADRDGELLPEETKLKLTDEGLQILSTNGDRPISNISSSDTKLESAYMEDSGNFVILDVNNNIKWQTFDYPTDTLIAGQLLRAGNKLVSSVSAGNHSSGRFQVVMQQDGNLVFYPVNTPDIGAFAYWASNTNGDGYTSVRLRYDGAFYLITVTNVTHNTTVDSSYTYFSRIEPDGFFRAYRTNDSSTELVNEYPAEQKCDIKGACGSNSYCNYTVSGNDSKGEAACLCLPGFVYTNQREPYMGCRRNFSMGQCVESNITYSITKLANLSWSDDPYNYTDLRTEEDCGNSCLRDCNCYAALFADNRCSKQRHPILYGKWRAGYSTAFLKVGSEEQTMPPSPAVPEEVIESYPSTKTLLLNVFLACGLILAFTAAFFFLYIHNGPSYQKKWKNMESGLAGGMVPQSFTYRQLVVATKGFTDVLGKGSFSTVFKGEISLGKDNMPIAVKRLEKLSEVNAKGFRTEMRAVGGAHHRNLVRLLGFCHEGTKWLLIYEYMDRGSLADLIFAPAVQKAPAAQEKPAGEVEPAAEKEPAEEEAPAAQEAPAALEEPEAQEAPAVQEAAAAQVATAEKGLPSWKKRAAIAMDVARGILYLHEGLGYAIIHSDIKPGNVLVAGNGTAKIGDLGLAKVLHPWQSKMHIELRGTESYTAPEWRIGDQPVNPKVDVYSFGVLLLELITCRKFIKYEAANDRIFLSEWAYNCLKNSTLEQLLPDAEEVDKGELEKMVKVSLWCVQKTSENRKSMKEVVRMLGAKMSIEVPPNDIFKLEGAGEQKVHETSGPDHHRREGR